ncbi:class I SAM-dependent methyltransferase [Patescibacteria group bacterium]|nr:class I SAM-dependent methyltransferase [Patescibacteria group bacterium]MBU1682602.1 class I SAM-dependent methyltransferase [Patescibacteria group bacterium]MBU1935659.1 class I SAM-dependent methyltransferase [Patescibacteria group bacterium]
MEKLVKYLKELKEYGIKNDIPNVTETVGRFLNMLVKIHKPKNILEIGCANGYSTIWMAEAAKSVDSKIHTIDYSKPSFEEAKKNLAEVNLNDCVKFIFGNALEVIPNLPDDLMFDFVFVDGVKRYYLDFWNAIQLRLSSRAVIIFDDMIAFPEKTKAFSNFIQSVEGFDQVLLPIDGDDGILFLIKD